MPGPGDGAFPVYDETRQHAGIMGTAIGGPWFNWKGRRIECDDIRWTAPDGREIVEGLVVPCPACQRPFIMPGIKPEMYAEESDRRLSLNVVMRCSGFWQQMDSRGQVRVGNDGRPMVQRCDWIGVIRSGVSHHPQCTAIHQHGCRGPHGQQCSCRMSRMDGNKDCHCGAVTVGG